MEDEISKLLKEKYNNTREVLKNTPRNQQYSKLIELDFEYIEEGDDAEKYEEDNAQPMNTRQKVISEYFECKSRLSLKIIQNFIEEIEDDDPNYPLLRKYFKQGGNHILELLKKSLVEYPSRQSILNAFAFLSRYHNVFVELVAAYTTACRVEENILVFKELVEHFYINVTEHDYDVFAALKVLCKDDQNKLKVINKIAEEFQMELELKTDFH